MACPDLTNAEGRHTGAVYGFLNIMFRIMEEEKPEYLTVAFDLSAPTFRHKRYEAYKGTPKTHAGGTSGTGSADQRDACCHGDQHHVVGRI